MRENVWERAEIFGGYIVENKATVRATAAKFNISKSTVHKDVSDRLLNLFVVIKFMFFNVAILSPQWIKN